MASQDRRNPIGSGITFEEGWAVIQEAVNKLIRIVEGVPEQAFTSEEYMCCYSTVYEICSPDRLGHDCQQLYDRYKKIYEGYIDSKVLPSLREKKDEILLQELTRRWSDYKVMMRWLSRFFHYLNRYFLREKKLPSLEETSFMLFYELVYGEMNDQVRDAVISMINRERGGEQIDQGLLKNALDIYVEMGAGSMKYYEKEFEEAMLENTAAFYSEKALNWITSKSYKDYMLEVNGCLERERDRVSCYLQSRSQNKLLEIVEHELLFTYVTELQEKKQLDGEAPSADEM